jgi:hypothetical protein
VRGTRSKIISARGGSRRWTMIVKQVVAEEPVCWLHFPRCTIRSQTADHYWPQKYRPDLATVRSNLRGACNYCNRARRHTLPQHIPRLRAQLEAKAVRRRPSNALGFFG